MTNSYQIPVLVYKLLEMDTNQKIENCGFNLNKLDLNFMVVSPHILDF
jgi:hypothetical protein